MFDSEQLQLSEEISRRRLAQRQRAHELAQRRRRYLRSSSQRYSPWLLGGAAILGLCFWHRRRTVVKVAPSASGHLRWLVVALLDRQVQRLLRGELLAPRSASGNAGSTGVASAAEPAAENAAPGQFNATSSQL